MVSEKYIEYIKIASRIIDEQGIDALRIRNVAKEAGCTSAVLYRHFENKEHLFMLASVKYLKPYIQEFMYQSTRTDITSIQMELRLWRVFINEAFHKRPYYEMLFFSEQKDMLSDCIYEYYQLFPEEQKRFDGFTASIIFSNNLSERELIRLRRAANEKLITLEKAKILTKLSVSVFNGMFLSCPASIKDEVSLQMIADECYQLIYELFRQYTHPGVVLDIDE